MKVPIHYPLALKRGTNELVHIDVVSNGLDCGCFCAACGSDLIAANNGSKQVHHFKHSKDLDCPFNNFETYVHWLAKYILESIDSIKLPEVSLSTLNIDIKIHRQLIDKVKLRFKKEGILSEINENEINFHNVILQKSIIVTPESCITEQVRRSPSGDIRVDAIMTIKGSELFFEPFYSNQIDAVKLSKIKELDVSTIGINLFSFIKKHGSDFTLDILKDYIQNDLNCKQWVYVRQDKLDRLIQNLFNERFENELKKLVENITKHKEVTNKINLKMDEINQLSIDILKLEEELPSKSILNLFKH